MEDGSQANQPSERLLKIVLVTFGSRGDVQPMMALSLALQSAGHDVLLVAPPEKGGWAAEMGCPFRPLGGNFTAFVDTMRDAHTLRSAIRFSFHMRKELKAQFDTLPAIVRGADLVVGASLAFGLPTVAESMGIHYRYLAFTPQLLPSKHHPFLAFKHHGLPGWYNLMTWWAAGMLNRFNLTPLINQKRKGMGLKPIRDVWLHILGKHVIVASDKAIADVPQDVDLCYTQTGYLHLEHSGAHLADLEAFLKAGPPPVYAGFGSMPGRDQAKLAPLVINAIRSSGQRVVLGKFWDGPSDSSAGPDVLFVRGYPHLELFPRMAAVIHHGGAGTTATSSASGVPQIVIPHVLDQYYWGHRVYVSRLGPKPIWRSRLNAGRLKEALDLCLGDHEIRMRAAAVSKEIDRPRSLEMTIQELVSIFH
jgi:UDP:flavonoid glycosyltransferase YjiC (YdhE family)